MLWSEEEKAMVGLAVGCLSYTSSGESDFSEDENGERHLTRYLVKKSPVERSRQSKVKKALDDVYIKSLHPRARVNMVTRQAHERPSSRYRPIKALEWAVIRRGSCYPLQLHPLTLGCHPAHHPSTNTSPTTMAASFLGTLLSTSIISLLSET